MTNDAKAPPQIFVGIGASAGGLAALKLLIPKLPLDRGCTYILIQQMDPTQKVLNANQGSAKITWV